MTKTIIWITSGLVLMVTFGIWTWEKKAEKIEKEVSKEIRIERTWKLPSELEEVSGIAFMKSDQIAAVQDEEGIIFIYDLKASEVLKKIPFAGAGDYEGIAVNGHTAYVLRSDGSIFQVDHFRGETEVTRFSTPLSEENDLEGLYFDSEKNRLLLAVKRKDPFSQGYKGIYSFDLGSKTFVKDPVFKMTYREELFGQRKGDVQNTFFPSEISRHPGTGKFLILEARNPGLLVLSSSGKAERLYRLDKKSFPQPEGITFDSQGRMYISNEGRPATIQQVTINQ